MSTRFSAQVLDADGRPLQQADVTVHTQRGARLVRCGAGRVTAGVLDAEADDTLGPLWGLRLDGRAVLTWPVRHAVDGGQALVELQPLALLPQPLAMPVLHALRGQVWGLPQAWQAVLAGASASRITDAVTLAAAPAAVAPALALARALPVAMSELVASAATQIHLGASRTAGLQLSTANVKLSGLGTSVGEQLGMQFPSTTEELASAAVTSMELSFAPTPVEAPAPPPAAVPTVPAVTGYTRELAVRKLAAAQYAVQLRVAATASERDAGRVLRQFPAAGQPLLAGKVVMLFVAQGAAPSLPE